MQFKSLNISSQRENSTNKEGKRMLFKGVATALVTPIHNDKIDYDKLNELIQIQINAGVNALVICGTTGESPTILDDEKEELFKKSVEFADGKIPVIAGTGTNNTSHIIKFCEYAQKAGADGFLINNPYYNKSSNEGIIANYEAISQNVDRPIIVYNVPSRTGKNISADLAIELCKIKHIEGFKEASGDISQIAEIIARKPDNVAVYSGNDDQILPILALGGMGVICTCSNIAPKLCCEITDSYFAGDIDKARAKQFELLDLFKAMFCDCNPIPVKTAMNMIGLDVGEMRLPLVELSGSKRKFVYDTLIKYGYKATL